MILPMINFKYHSYHMDLFLIWQVSFTNEITLWILLASNNLDIHVGVVGYIAYLNDISNNKDITQFIP